MACHERIPFESTWLGNLMSWLARVVTVLLGIQGGFLTLGNGLRSKERHLSGIGVLRGKLLSCGRFPTDAFIFTASFGGGVVFLKVKSLYLLQFELITEEKNYRAQQPSHSKKTNAMQQILHAFRK